MWEVHLVTLGCGKMLLLSFHTYSYILVWLRILVVKKFLLEFYGIDSIFPAFTVAAEQSGQQYMTCIFSLKIFKTFSLF